VLRVPHTLEMAAASFFVFGLSNAFFYSPNLKLLPQVCPKDDQPLALAVNIAVTGMAAGVSPMIWGFFVKRLDGSPGMLKGPFLAYLGILAAAQLVLLPLFLRIREKDGGEAIPKALGLHIRFTRYASQLLGYAFLRRKS